MHWAAERVVDHRTRMADDNEKLANIMLGLLNEGVYRFSFGTLLLSAAHGDAEIDEFMAALERTLHAVDLVA
jgi:glutamate-1-semialdehyde aminotransferase